MPTKRTVHLARGKLVYAQGERADCVYYTLKGTVLQTLVSPTGKEGVVEILGPGDLFGESCILDRQAQHGSSALALERSTLICLEKTEVRSALRRSPECSEEFMSHLFARNQKVRQLLANQLFHSSELRLAFALRSLAQPSPSEQAARIPRISQTTLASMVGTTRSRVSCFLVKFRQLGILTTGQGLCVHTALLDAFLAEQAAL